MNKKETIVLFQGDSITDAGRNRDLTGPNQGLGTGYPNLISSRLLAANPDKGLRCYNRGISGNRVVDLYARWKVDALNIKPDVISILIGVNDTWHDKKHSNGVEVPRYREIYRMLLELTTDVLPDVRLVLCEPFVLPIGAVEQDWVPEIDERREIVRELCEEYQATFVGFQSAFDQACARASAQYWLADGVHPTPAGHYLLAERWLDAVELF